MNSRISSCITHGVRVNVSTTYLTEESSPRHQYFVFAYQVEIINESPYEVQLISREWLIVDGLGVHQKVEGKGVIGQQPFILPAGVHRYVSSSHFPTSVGRMSGYYTMVRQVDREMLRIQIPPFVMEAPFVNN